MALMNSGKMMNFVKRWRALEKQRADYEYNLACFVRDLRAACGGTDAAFVQWCTTELGQTEGQALALLPHAAVLAVVPDLEDWNRLGGWRQLKNLTALPSEKSRRAVVEKARHGSAISTVIRESRQAVGSGILAAEHAAAASAPAARATTPTHFADASRLARFVLANVDQTRLTPAVRETIARYVHVEKSATLTVTTTRARPS